MIAAAVRRLADGRRCVVIRRLRM